MNYEIIVRMMARWIRLGAIEPSEFEAAYATLANAQGRASAPILLWAETPSHYLFALIAPRKFAPGRVSRWIAWGLASAVATYRQFGVPAYFDAGALWLHGGKIAEASVVALGECAVIASSFLARFPAKCVVTPSALVEHAFRLRLEAQHGWQFDHSWPQAAEARTYAVA
jgi:hypothetical protein